MRAAFELFDHTADIGIRARAGSLAELVAPAAEGLYAVIGEIAVHGEPVRKAWHLTGDDSAILLRDFLAELLAMFDRDRRIVRDVAVGEFSPSRLIVEASAYPIDGDRSALHREVKAVTYHALAVNEIPGGYEATVIVDI
jgi:SHS2 domain-containing protein